MPESRGVGREDLKSLALLVLTVLTANAVLLLSDSTWQHLHHTFSYDFDMTYLQLRPYLLETYGQGRLPLWQEHQTAGGPAIGLYGSALLHFSVLFMFLDPLHAAVAANTVCQLELTALFAYLLLSQLGLGRVARFTGAALLALSGYPVWASPIISFINSVPCVVMWLWATAGWVNQPRWKWWALHTVALFFLLTSGDVQGLALAACWGPVWLVLALAFTPGGLRTLPPLLGSAVLALAAAAVQLIPAIAYFFATVKAVPFSRETFLASFLSLPELAVILAGLAAKVFPPLSLSLVAIVFFVFGLRRFPASPLARASAITVLLIVLLYGTGRYGGGMVYYLFPLLGSMTAHYKVGPILYPLFIAVAAYGLDTFLAGPSPRRRRAGWLIAALAVAECGVVLWAPVGHFPAWQFWSEYRRAAEETRGRYRVGVMYPAAWTMDFDYLRDLPVQPGEIFGEDSFDSYLSYPPAAYARLLGLVQPGCLLARDGNRRLEFSANFKSRDFITPGNRRLVNLLGVRYLLTRDFALAEADQFPILLDPAVLPLGKNATRLELPVDGPANLGYAAHLSANDRLALRAAADRGPIAFAVMAAAPGGAARRLWYARTVGPGGVAAAELLPPGAAERSAMEFVSLPADGSAKSGARWVDPRIIRPDKTLRLKKQSGPLLLYENPEALPRFFLVHRARAAGDADGAERIMREAGFDPRREAVVYGEGLEPSAVETSAGETVRVEQRGLDDYRVEARLVRSGVLVWTENYFPGWRAWVDGREVRVRRADLAFKAVFLGPGVHQVRFRYEPWCFRIGLWLSLGSVLGFLAVSAARLKRRTRQR